MDHDPKRPRILTWNPSAILGNLRSMIQGSLATVTHSLGGPDEKPSAVLGRMLLRADRPSAPEPAPEPEPEPEPAPAELFAEDAPAAAPPPEPEIPPETEIQAEPEPAPQPKAGLEERVDAIVKARAKMLVGNPGLPEARDALDRLLDDGSVLSDFQAMDLLFACWPRGTAHCKDRALLAVAYALANRFGLPGGTPMALAAAWRMLDPRGFEMQLAFQLEALDQFIREWQATQSNFLVLEFGEIELVEYLFESLHPGDHMQLLAKVMNFKVLSNRRLGLIRRIPVRARKQAEALATKDKQEALIHLAHYKALLEKIGDPNGFQPIVQAAGKAREDVEKVMKAMVTPPPGAPGPGGAPPGGLALGKIG
jgi:hypothetical protein